MITRLVIKIFGYYAMRNLRKDFMVMAQRMNQRESQELMKLCFIWFILGHVNSADKESHFNKYYNGDQGTGGPH